MILPSRNLGGFARDLIDVCTVDRTERIQRGAVFRNFYLTGSADGEMQTYPKMNQLIDDYASYMFSPVEMRLAMEHYGQASIAEVRKGRAAAAQMHKMLRRRHVDTKVSEAVKWSVIKGKAFLKLNWTEDGYSPQLVQPEYMGVLQPELTSLDEQDAFVQSTYMTEWGFARLIERHPDRVKLMETAKRHMNPGKGSDQPGQQTWLKSVILGGNNPYKQAGSRSQNNSRGIVNWMDSPAPTLDPQIVASMIRVDELWVWNDTLDDYTTIQVMGDHLIAGNDRFTNIFADDMWIKKADEKDKFNPLLGKQPFVEFCPNPLDGYFWGDSEVRIVAAAQIQLNQTIDGINHLLRLQEKPPRSFIGMTGITQAKASLLNKPGAYLSDTGNTGKIDKHAPEIPAGLYDRIDRSLDIMHDLMGMRAVMRGEGEAGVRSQSHANALTRNASPNFKDKAVLVERHVEEVCGLGFDIARARVTKPVTCWLMPSDESIEAAEDNVIPMEAPAKGMKPVTFQFHDLSDEVKIAIDSHSASPIFYHEKKAEIFDLVKIGAITLEQAVERLHPSGEDEILGALERKEIRNAEMFAKLPPEEQAKVIASGGKKRR